jgi:hypothetical protein
MKLSLIAGCAALLLSPVAAFQVATTRTPQQQQPQQQQRLVSLTPRHMFGGAGEGSPTEDNPEEQAQMEATAKSMGMGVDEYKVAMNARTQLAKEMDSTMVSAGNAATVSVERDVNNPPKTLNIKITEEGKALGKADLSKELVSALKAASEESKGGREASQKKMMQYITDQLKQ